MCDVMSANIIIGYHCFTHVLTLNNSLLLLAPYTFINLLDANDYYHCTNKSTYPWKLVNPHVITIYLGYKWLNKAYAGDDEWVKEKQA